MAWLGSLFGGSSKDELYQVGKEQGMAEADSGRNEAGAMVSAYRVLEDMERIKEDMGKDKQQGYLQGVQEGHREAKAHHARARRELKW
jgi:hypothetical protein